MKRGSTALKRRGRHKEPMPLFDQWPPPAFDLPPLEELRRLSQPDPPPEKAAGVDTPDTVGTTLGDGERVEGLGSGGAAVGGTDNKCVVESVEARKN